MQYYEIEIVKSAKPLGKGQTTYTIFDTEEKRFSTKEEVKDFLRHTYGNVKRIKSFVDDKRTEEIIQEGWVYCFKNRETKPFYQRDWVTVYLINAVPVMV